MSIVVDLPSNNSSDCSLRYAINMFSGSKALAEIDCNIDYDLPEY